MLLMRRVAAIYPGTKRALQPWILSHGIIHPSLEADPRFVRSFVRTSTFPD